MKIVDTGTAILLILEGLPPEEKLQILTFVIASIIQANAEDTQSVYQTFGLNLATAIQILEGKPDVVN